MSTLEVVLLMTGLTWLLVPAPAGGRLAQTASHRGAFPLRTALTSVTASLIGACALALGIRVALWATLGVVLIATVTHVVLARRQAGVERRRRTEAARAARVLASQLRVGQVPTEALRTAADDCAALERAAATLAVGGDVAASLRVIGEQPGYEGLTDLAMAWELSERSGAPVAGLARSVSDLLRQAEITRAAVTTELAASRATGRLLAGLPLVGIALGVVAGGHPVHFLTATTGGLVCLLVGVTLACAGVLWTEWLADRVQT